MNFECCFRSKKSDRKREKEHQRAGNVNKKTTLMINQGRQRSTKEQPRTYSNKTKKSHRETNINKNKKCADMQTIEKKP